MRTRIIAVAIAAVLAVAGAVALVVAFRAADQAAVAGAQLHPVLVVTSEIPAGTDSAALGDAVEVRQIPATYIAEGAVADLDALAGQVAAVTLQPGEQVLAARFASPAELASAGVHVAVPAGLQEVSIAVDLQRIAGGSVGPGERVGVFASYDNGGADKTTTLLLNRVLVTSVASTVDPDAGGQQAQGLVLVTLALDADQARAVVNAAEFGHIWMSAQNDDTAVPAAAPSGGVGAGK
ncbi:MAG TPA: Flp pilus assembly protein CpaB [Pseudolysinimonas sp.]|nr:Flp pilus assembly protein CpaB [Pseudolysinimonas sp.]